MGKRLRGPRLFAAEIGSGHGFFFDGPERRAGHAVEDEELAVLRALRDGVDFFSAVGYGEEQRRARQILVEQIVVDHLEMPEPLASGGVERDEGVGEKIFPVALGAIEVGLGRLRRDVNDAAFLVERLARPRHDAGGRLPGVGGPGVVAEFAGAWNQVKNPAARAGAHIEAAHGAGAADAADDERISVEDTGGVEADIGRGVRIESGAEDDGAVVAKRGDRLAGLRIEGEEEFAHGGKEARFAAGIVLPIHEAALAAAASAGGGGGRIPFPQFAAGRGVERDDAAALRGGVEHAADDEIVGLVFALFAGVVGPCDLELRDVAAVDLLERRVEAALFVAEVGGPVGVGRSARGGNDDRRKRKEYPRGRGDRADGGDGPCDDANTGRE